MLGPADNLVFEGFRLDSAGLFRIDEAGVFTPVPLGSRAIALLGLLAGRCGELISKDEIMQAVWPHTIVEENNLTVQISALRRLLDAGRAEGSCIQNVPGRGYRFVAPVTRVEPTVSDCPSMLGDDRSPLSGAGRPPPGASTYHNIPAASSVSEVRAQKRHWSARIAALMGALGVLLILVTISWRLHLPTQKQDPAPRLSIVVLPFTNLSDDREQQYFADAITDDLTTDLSRHTGMLVISVNTAFTYKDKPVDTKQIGRELGVRYILEGSIRRSRARIRVNVQLIAAETDTHLLAEHLDYDVDDTIALQTEITGRIANALDVTLVKAEAARAPEHPDVLDYNLRGRAAWLRPHSRENYEEVTGWFERALALDPNSAAAQGLLASALIARVLDRMSDSPARDIDRAELLSTQAVAASPNSPHAHYAKGQVLRLRKRYEEAIPEYEEVLALDPSWANALHGLSVCKLLTGSIEDAIPLEERAIRLSPRDTRINVWYTQIGLVHLLQSRTDQAIVWLQKARNGYSGHPSPHALLASAYALKGEAERASFELTEARKLRGEHSFSTIAEIKANAYWGVPAIRNLFETTYLAGLRKAGVPEE
jgi:TolB-like protein/DNA-binding winged helix-turn-helix (wHTH) protein